MSSSVVASRKPWKGGSALQDAVEAVKTGMMTYRQAAAAFGLGRNTIYEHVHQLVQQSATGRPPVPSDLEETIIVRWFSALASFGYPDNRDIVVAVISKLP